jgi:hypothetical protein
MSCPDWRRLDPAARDASGAPHGSAGSGAAADALDAVHAVHWQQALSHLDSGCPHCWREALAVDPTLVFRRLPAPELSPAQEAEEVEAARLAVAAMRTASRLDAAAGAPGVPGVRWWRSRRGRRAAGDRSLALRRLPSIRSLSLPSHVHPARWAVAASLTAMALVYGSGHGWRPTTATALTSGRSPAGSPGAAGSESPAGSESTGSSASPSTQVGQETPAASGFAAAATGQAMPMPGGPGPAPRTMPPGWAAAAGIQPASSRPSIEGLSRPEARVYQLDSPHMSVVMIVDGKLDV